MPVRLNTLDLPDGVMVQLDETRLDAAVALRFKDRLRDIVHRHGPVILLDLAQVDFMDSSGLGAILGIRRALPAGRRIELTGLTPNVDRVLRLTRMDAVFTIHPNGTADWLREAHGRDTAVPAAEESMAEAPPARAAGGAA